MLYLGQLKLIRMTEHNYNDRNQGILLIATFAVAFIVVLVFVLKYSL